MIQLAYWMTIEKAVTVRSQLLALSSICAWNHEGGAKRILNSAIGTVDPCYRRVTFELCIQFETAIVSDHTSHYFKIFKLHLNIFPISETTVTKPQLYYIRTGSTRITMYFADSFPFTRENRKEYCNVI